VPVAGRVSEHLGVPSWVDNDATLGTLAEQRWGALREVRDGVFLKLSDGVGAGLVLDGRLYRGPDGTAGEIGHVAVDPGDRHAAVCRCGHRGCLETVVSTRTVTALLEPLVGAPLTVAEMVALARDGDAPARRVLADTGHHVGVALAGFCTVLTPRRIVVGGELAQAGDFLLAPLHAALEAAALPGTTRTADVVVAELAEHAPVLGALALALDRATTAP
jgi:predicted NBD/HSP70 family sugar kinase